MCHHAYSGHSGHLRENILGTWFKFARRESFDAWFDQEGKEVDVKWVKTKYNKYALVGRGIFASSERALTKKTGWVMKKIQAPAWAKIVAGGSGMYGAFNSSVSIYRISENKITEVDC